ncbi:MAG: cysteine hydrolase family protein [Nocardioidaceae bacterium]
MDALLIVDMQNDFCHPEGALAKRGTDAGGMQDVADANARLAEAFRQEGRPVLFARTEHGAWTDSATWRGRIKPPGKDVDTIPVCATEWGASFFGIAPSDCDRVIVKHRYSAFYATDLEIVLRAKGIDSVCVTGVLTNVCVESTVRDGFMRDYAMTVVAEGCTTNTAAEHDMALQNIATYFGSVRSLPDVLADLPPTR